MEGALSRPGRPQENPMLRQIIDNAEAKVPEKLKEEYTKVMGLAGKIMWSSDPELQKERQIFEQQLQQSKDIPTSVAHAVIKVVGIIQNESQMKEPLVSVGLAAPVLMAHILQYVESKMKMPVTKEVIDQTGQMLQVNLLKAYGVTEDQIKGLFTKQAGGQGMDGQNPQDMKQAADGQMEPPAGPMADGRETREEDPEEEHVAPAEETEEEEA